MILDGSAVQVAVNFGRRLQRLARTLDLHDLDCRWCHIFVNLDHRLHQTHLLCSLELHLTFDAFVLGAHHQDYYLLPVRDRKNMLFSVKLFDLN